jgi:hypothetical protein
MNFFKNFTNSLGLFTYKYWRALIFVGGFAGFVLLYLISIPVGFWQKWSGTESATHPFAPLFGGVSTSLLIIIAVVCLIIVVLYFVGGYKINPKRNPKIIKKGD